MNKRKISWILLLWTAYLILLLNDWKNLKYFPNLIRELCKMLKKYSSYTEDGDFVLIHKEQLKKL